MTLFGFGKKKEKEINAPVCTCNGNCSVSETVEPENLNNCCQDFHKVHSLLNPEEHLWWWI